VRVNRRRVLALVACTLWLLGIEALPNLHLATHGDDHTHARDGSIVRPGEHRHGDVVHSHAPKPKPQRRVPQLAFDDASSGHAAAGIAHHAIALHQPAPPLLAPLPVDRPLLHLEHAMIGVAPAIALDRPHARGPPA
jgi:hypothetical protein